MTDLKPLVSIFHNKRLGSLRLDQMKLRHEDVKYNLIWQKGAINPADYISCHAIPFYQLPKHIQKETEEYGKLCWFLHSSPYLESISHETIKEHTQHDKVLQCLKQHIINQQQTSMHHELHSFLKIFPEITISDGGLLMPGEQILLPNSLVHIAIEKAHQGGHPGESSMKRHLRTQFWFAGLDMAVKDKIKSCPPCQLYTQKTTKEPQSMLIPPTTAWEKVSLDLFSPTPTGKYVLVAQDILSRYPAAIIVPDTKVKRYTSS